MFLVTVKVNLFFLDLFFTLRFNRFQKICLNSVLKQFNIFQKVKITEIYFSGQLKNCLNKIKQSAYRIHLAANRPMAVVSGYPI
jgi:hypothetical protein